MAELRQQLARAAAAHAAMTELFAVPVPRVW
jgi:hypothetical protein